MRMRALLTTSWLIRQTRELVAIKFLPRGPEKVTKLVERELRCAASCHAVSSHARLGFLMSDG